MVDIKLEKVDEVHLKVRAEDSIRKEIQEKFTFEIENKQWNPLVKARKWDGKIRLYDMRTHRIYFGLLHQIEAFAKKKGYTLECDFDRSHDISPRCVKKLFEAVENFKNKVGDVNEDQLEVQLKYVTNGIMNHRGVMLSSTGSGKSFMMYLFCIYYLELLEIPKILIIVPTTSLVSQMATDFESYGMDLSMIHQITGGSEKQSLAPITVSTWQSIYKMPESYLNQYNMVLADECHGAEAKSLTRILECMKDCKYRFGFTGTLKETKTNPMTLNGLLGDIKKYATTRDYIDMGAISDVEISSVIIRYDDDDVEKVNKYFKQYKDEIDFIINHPKRLMFTAKVAGSEPTNTLVLFTYVEKHGMPLYAMIEDMFPDRKVFFVAGGVAKEDREAIRQIAEENHNCIIVASYGTFSTGINIRNLHRVIFASPYKSKVKVLQSLGRGLRKHSTKEKLQLIDIVDDLSDSQRKNHVMRHYDHRKRMYKDEGLCYNTYNVEF